MVEGGLSVGATGSSEGGIVVLVPFVATYKNSKHKI